MPTKILYGVVLITAGIAGLWYDGWLRKRGKRTTGSIVNVEGQDDPIPRNGETRFRAVLQCISGLALGVGFYQIVTYLVHVR
jgi:hypothetical protein